MIDFEQLRTMLPTGLWIDGAETDPIDGGTFPVYDPATGRRIAEVADAGAKDAKRALHSAVTVQAKWAATAPRQRSIILRSAWERIIERTDDHASCHSTAIKLARSKDSTASTQNR